MTQFERKGAELCREFQAHAMQLDCDSCRQIAAALEAAYNDGFHAAECIRAHGAPCPGVAKGAE